MNCQYFEELAGAYALGALTPEEQRQADEHVKQCPHCQATLHELSSVVNLLPMSIPIIEPSPLLKQRILASITTQDVQHIPTSQVAPFTPTPTPITRRSRSVWKRYLFALASAAILVLLIGSVIWNIFLQQQIAQQATISNPVVYTLNSSSGTDTIVGQIVYFPQQQVTTLIVQGLPALSGSQIYQGWLLQGDQPQSIGRLDIQNDIASLRFQGNLQDYDTAAISLEPGPQTSENTPQGPILALGSLQNDSTSKLSSPLQFRAVQRKKNEWGGEE